MFNIENNTLYKYTGNDKVVTIPDNVEVINTNAFEDNENIEVIIGNNVKRLYYNAINLPNLKVLELPNVQEIQQLNDLKKLEYLKVNINTSFASIRYLNPNLELELVNKNESVTYTSNPKLLNKLDYIKSSEGYSKDDLFLIVFNNKVKKFAITEKMENYTLFLNNICFIERFFSNIPKQYKNLIFDNKYSFCILNDNIILDDEYIGGIIYKNLELGLFSAQDVIDCFIHEIARIIDDEYNLSSTEDFNMYFKLESKKMYSKTSTLKKFDLEYMYHIIQNPHEYFCEAFNRFYKKDLMLKEECPITWDFLSDLDFQLKNENDKKLIYK